MEGKGETEKNRGEIERETKKEEEEGHRREKWIFVESEIPVEKR